MVKPMWMVRAASGGRLADGSKEKELVATGWGDIVDLDKYKDKAAILKAIGKTWQ